MQEPTLSATADFDFIVVTFCFVCLLQKYSSFPPENLVENAVPQRRNLCGRKVENDVWKMNPLVRGV